MKSSKSILKTLKNNFYINLSTMVVVTIVIVTFIRRFNMEEKTRKDFDFIYQAMDEDLRSNVLENKGAGCVMPKLDPFYEEAVEHKKLPTGVCEGKDWVECVFDKCFVAKSVQEDLKDVTCIYRDIVFVGNETHHLGLPKTLNGGQTYRLKKSDFVHVSCVGTNRLRPGPQFKWSGHKAGLRRVRLRKRSSRAPRFNVAMVCFDTMSRNGFVRTMPESLAALKKMGAFIFNGYNIVGGETSGALLPIFMGNETDNGRRFTELFDGETCMFHRLYNMGYRTAYFGDSPVHGTFEGAFNVSQRLPTDHHLLPLLYGVYGKTRAKASTINFCIGEMPLYRLLLNLTYQFNRLNGPRFSFTFITDVNHGEFNMASAADADLADFLRRFHDIGNMKRTMLFVMGAHGTSFSSARDVPQLTLEDRLPLMAIVVPDRLKQTRPDAAAAMAANVDVLTTPYDIHSTLTDILNIGDQRNRYKVPGADMERGLTLLRPIPSSRSCGEAGVAPHWCACARWEPLDPRDPLRKEIGTLLADYINEVGVRMRLYCKAWKLVSIEHVLRLLSNKKNGDQENLLRIDKWIVPRSKYYKAKIIMSPGAAVFEGTLRYYSKLDYFAIIEQDISRVNSYVNDSACLTFKYHGLNKFCYCRE